MQADTFTELSRLFIYYNARAVLGETQQDSGTTVRAGIRGVRSNGICSESIWPYDVSRFDVKPSDVAYADAKSRNIEKYQRLVSNSDMIDSLNISMPIVIAADVFDEFMNLSGPDSTIPMPGNPWAAQGHALCVIGYDLDRAAFLIKNSFGTAWGDNGYCWMPFDYADKYVFERWSFTIKQNFNEQSPR